MASRNGAAGQNPKTHHHHHHHQPHPGARPCLCSPTTHPGSFRCSLHRRAPVRAPARQWQLQVMAKADSIKAFLLQIIKPSSHDLQRRRNFQPRPSRFCMMNGNRDGVPVS